MLDVILLLACACDAHSHSCRQPHQPLLALVLTQRGWLEAVPHDHGTDTGANTHACAVHGTDIVAVYGADGGTITVADHASTNRRDRARVRVPVQRTHERGWRRWPLRALECIPACVVFRVCCLPTCSRGGRYVLGVLQYEHNGAIARGNDPCPSRTPHI